VSQADYDKVLVEYSGQAATVSPYADNVKILDDGSAGWGQFDKGQGIPNVIDDECYLIPNFLSGGDYANSTLVEVSNHKLFLERYGSIRGVIDVSGSHGSFAVAINLAVVSPAEDELWADLLELKDYPVLDEEHHSNMEFEAQEEAWVNWGRKDFIREIKKSFDLSEEDEEILDGLDGNDPQDRIYGLFRQLSEDANEYWETEAGGGQYINIERIVQEMNDDELNDLLRPPPPPDTGPQLWDIPPSGPAPSHGGGGPPRKHGIHTKKMTKEEYERMIRDTLGDSYLQPNPRRRRR
jgi:hypothetical protein